MTKATHQEFAPDMRVGGARYILRRKLGQGGAGVVWQAWDSKLEQEVALKLFPEAVLGDGNLIERLRSDARRNLQLAHPNIVRTYDFIRDHDLAAVAMEYVDGWSLGALRVDRPQQRFRLEEIRPWVTQLAGALEHAYSQGVLHLGLKPSNLLLARSGEIKVSDFGLAGTAQKLSSQLDPARMAERAGFMSPQQAMGEPATVADDIYSLGATIYALLTGTAPFYKGEVLAQVRELPPPRMGARLKELGIEETIPAIWEETVAACLAKEPSKRPRSVKEVLRLLDQSEAAPQVEPALAPVAAAVENAADSGPKPAVKERRTLLVPAGAVAVLLAVVLAVWFWSPRSGVAVADKTKPDRLGWFNEARFGMFIHWGLYAVPAGEWEGKENYGEWFQLQTKMPNAQYEKFAAQFNPTKFNAREWVRVAKDAGMKYMVITSKHHDGFCMYDTKLTDYNIVKATPFRRDPMKELAAACREAGVKFCFYYSVPDWHHAQFPARFSQRGFHGAPNPGADLEQYVAYLKGQVRELLTGYGPLGILWFDGGGSFKAEAESRAGLIHAQEVIDLIHRLQPQCLVNNRLGLPGDYGTPEQKIPGARQTNAFEVCMTLNKHWGYNKHDGDWKSPRQIIQNLVDIASKGGNYLLNVGPTAEGLFPKESVDILEAVGQWMRVNGEAIYGTGASPLEQTPAWGRCTQKVTTKGTTLYLHVFDWPQTGKLVAPGLGAKADSVRLLVAGTKLESEVSDEGLVINVPASAPEAISSTIVVKTSGPLALGTK